MVTSAELAKSVPVRQKGEDNQPGKKSVQPGKSASPSKRKLQFWLLLVCNVVVCVLVYNLWMGWRSSRVWDYLTVNRGMVTGIMYNAENPCAIIYGKVVHQGDTVDGYKVVKIYRTEVELQKNGKNITKRVH